MAEYSSTDLLRNYIEDAIAAEKNSEVRLRSFADDTSDDVEVRSLLLTHADETYVQRQRLTDRLESLGGKPPVLKDIVGEIFTWASRTATAKQLPEERIVQNLIAAFSIEQGECALYEALVQVARRAGDQQTETLALKIQAEENKTAERLWHLLPSRSKIAFNMLTVGEVDPSVETKTQDDQILLDT